MQNTEFKKHKQPWTKEEADLMKEMIFRKVNYKDIAKKLGRSHSACASYGRDVLKISSQHKYRKNFHNIDFWSMPNKNNSYWAGFTAADGCLYGATKDRSVNAVYAMSLKLSDKGQLEQLKKDCSYTGLIREYKNAGFKKDTQINPKDSFLAQIRVSGCYQWLKDLKENFNIEPKKTYRLGPPSKLSLENQLCYLIGYTDGDGNINHQYKENVVRNSTMHHVRISFASCSPKMLDWIKLLIDKIVPIEFSPTPWLNPAPINDKGNRHVYGIAGRRALLLYSFLKDFNVPKLSRKWLQPKVLALLSEKQLQHPEIFAKFKAHTDSLLAADTPMKAYQIT